MTMRVGTWNINAIRGAGEPKLQRVAQVLDAHRVDVVALQEVRFGPTTTQLVDELDRIGLTRSVLPEPGQATEAERPKRYGTVLAARWPMTAARWRVHTRWPQLLTAADVQTSSASFRLIGAHIPNGSGNGWEKVYALEALGAALASSDVATVLAGDFKEPKAFEPFTSFRTLETGMDGDFVDDFGVSHPRLRWHDAVAHVLAVDPAACGWPGQHAEMQVGRSFEPSHLVHGRFDRYFDHIMTTADLPVVRMAYDHSVRSGDPQTSDHSLVVVEIEGP